MRVCGACCMCAVLVLLLCIILSHFQGCMYELVHVFVLFCIIALHSFYFTVILIVLRYVSRLERVRIWRHTNTILFD